MSNPQSLAPGKVGIWKAADVNGEKWYVRDENMRHDWRFWASINKIAPKGKEKRVVYLGESVARGYFYDPHYTPAQVLKQMLDTPGREVDVIDLARVSIEMTELKALTFECAALQPDAVVIFAGNNWNVTVMKNAVLNIDKMSSIREHEGIEGLWREMNRQHQLLITDYMQSLQSLFTSKGIPVVFIVPEFNLMDWKSNEQEQIIPVLDAVRTEKWIATQLEAEEHFSNGDMIKAEEAAHQLTVLDFTHALGYEMLAQCKLVTGNVDEARTYLEKARDTALLPKSTATQARVFSIIADTLMAEGKKYGLSLIDSREVLKTFRNGALPGRELFLDYCHLTVEGIQLVMKETALRVSGLISSGCNVAAGMYRPSGDVEAKAFFCAAVHNAHYGQSSEILRYLCKSALDCSLSIADLMIKFADFATRRLSNVLCKTHELLMAGEEIVQYERGFGFLHPRGGKVMDMELVDIIVEALAEKDIHISERISSLRKKEHGLVDTHTNLLESYYSKTSYNRFPGKTSSYFKAHNFRTGFMFVAEDKQDIELQMTYRTKGRDGTEHFNMEVNGQRVASLPSADSWLTRRMHVPGQYIKDGVNKITIFWPYRNTGVALQSTPEPLDDDDHFLFLDELYTVFGEIHTFTASRASGCTASVCLQCQDCKKTRLQVSQPDPKLS
jgi:hypothetical protein